MIATLHTFNQDDGANPYSGLIQGSDGAFYGTTRDGGDPQSNPGGTIFRITTAGAFTSLHTFDTTANGGFFTFGGTL